MGWVLYISVSVWVLGIPDTGQNMSLHFSPKNHKKEEKAKQLRQNQAKKVFLSLLTKATLGFYSQ